MARWKIVEREYHNHKWDLITVHILYERVAVNQYLILKDEKQVPKHLLRERKWGITRALDGKPWKEGTIKRQRKKAKKPTKGFKHLKAQPRRFSEVSEYD